MFINTNSPVAQRAKIRVGSMTSVYPVTKNGKSASALYILLFNLR